MPNYFKFSPMVYEENIVILCLLVLFADDLCFVFFIKNIYHIPNKQVNTVEA